MKGLSATLVLLGIATSVCIVAHAMAQEVAKKKSCCPAPLCTMPKDYQCIYGSQRYPDQEDAVDLQNLGFHYFCGEKTRSCIGGRVCEKGEFVPYFCRRKGQRQAVTSERDLPKGYFLVHTDPPKAKDAGVEGGITASGAGGANTILSATASAQPGVTVTADSGASDAGLPSNRTRRKREDSSSCSIGTVGGTSSARSGNGASRMLGTSAWVSLSVMLALSAKLRRKHPRISSRATRRQGRRRDHPS